jgi:hypothetical protein
VAIVTQRDLSPNADGRQEKVLLVVDRALKTWSQYHHFLFLAGEELQMGWFSSPPTQTILGQVILLLRPKAIVEGAAEADGWEIEE